MQSHWFHYMGKGGVAVEWWAVMLAYLVAVTPEFRENLFPRKHPIITLPEPAQPEAPGARVEARAKGGGWVGPY